MTIMHTLSRVASYGRHLHITSGTSAPSQRRVACRVVSALISIEFGHSSDAPYRFAIQRFNASLYAESGIWENLGQLESGMSEADIVVMEPHDALPSGLRSRIVAQNLEPLWESRNSHKLDSGAPDDGHHWRWADMRQIMMDVGEVSSPKIVERRVLSMLDPHGRYRDGEATVGCINATMQMLKPGEQARPHRHTMNALRFVLESTGGAKTVVDGKECAMEQGDLVLTPAWTWHTHKHEGAASVIWLDVLDVALHRFLGIETFQPGPITDVPPQLADATFGVPNMVPLVASTGNTYSPVFRYPWAETVRAIEATPVNPEGLRRVRYANPLTGGESMDTLDSTLVQIDAGMASREVTMVADAVYCVVEGAGSVTVGETRRSVSPRDIVTVPARRPLRLSADQGATFRLFSVSNSPVFRKLGLYAVDIKD